MPSHNGGGCDATKTRALNSLKNVLILAQIYANSTYRCNYYTRVTNYLQGNLPIAKISQNTLGLLGTAKTENVRHSVSLAAVAVLFTISRKSVARCGRPRFSSNQRRVRGRGGRRVCFSREFL